MSQGKHPNSLAALAAHRKNTQFGEIDGNPHFTKVEGGNKPWSVRQSVRYIGAQRIDPDDSKAMRKILPKKPTASQIMAANTFANAISGQNINAVKYITEQIDGKTETNSNNADFAAILEMSDDELIEYAIQLEAEILALVAAELDSDASGTEEPAPSPIIIENEDECGGATTDTDGV